MNTLVRDLRTGEIETTDRAILHKEDGHCCIICGCAQRIARSAAGRTFARLPAHGVHMPGCHCAAWERDKRWIDISLSDPMRIDKLIMTPRREGRGGGGDPGVPRGGEEKVSEIRSLRDMYRMGLCDVSNFAFSKKVRLCDILLNKFTVHTILIDNAGIGNRAVWAKPDGVNWDTLSLRFWVGRSLRMANNEERKVFKLLVLRFEDRNAFAEYVDRLFVKNEKRKYESKYDWVLIYGHCWTAVNQLDCKTLCKRNECIGNWVCSGLQCAKCELPSRQIYLPPKTKKGTE